MYINYTSFFIFSKNVFMKFKEGDKVRRIGDSAWGIIKGEIYTVRKVINNNEHIYLKELSGTWQTCRFELVESETYNLIEIF